MGCPGASDHRAGLVEHHPEDLLDLVEVLLGADQRRRELYDGVAPVVGPAVEPLGIELLGDEAEEEALALFGGEGLLGRLVLDQLDPCLLYTSDAADE